MQADLEIADQFSFLEKERGFRCIHRSYDEKFFGNAIVEYESASLRLVFDHYLLHEGTRVVEGQKYVLRSDIMYGPADSGDRDG